MTLHRKQMYVISPVDQLPIDKSGMWRPSATHLRLRPTHRPDPRLRHLRRPRRPPRPPPPSTITASPAPKAKPARPRHPARFRSAPGHGRLHLPTGPAPCSTGRRTCSPSPATWVSPAFDGLGISGGRALRPSLLAPPGKVVMWHGELDQDVPAQMAKKAAAAALIPGDELRPRPEHAHIDLPCTKADEVMQSLGQMLT